MPTVGYIRLPLFHGSRQPISTTRKISQLFPAKCHQFEPSRLFCDVSSSILPTAKSSTSESFVDVAQKVEGFNNWRALLDRFETVPSFDVSRVTERMVQRGRWPDAIDLYRAWFERLRQDKKAQMTFPYESPSATPSSFTSGLPLRMVYISMRAALSGEKSAASFWDNGELSSIMRPALFGPTARSGPERVLWQRLFKLVACTSSLDNRLLEFRQQGKGRRLSVRSRCAEDVHQLLRPLSADLDEDCSAAVDYIFEKVFLAYEDCSSFSNTNRVRIGTHNTWRVILDRVWFPWLAELQQFGGTAHTLVTLFTLDVIGTSVAHRSLARERYLESLQLSGGRRGPLESAKSVMEMQQRVVDPAPHTRHSTLRPPEGADSVTSICSDAHDVVAHYLSGAFEAWEKGRSADLPPLAVFLQYFRLVCRCGHTELVSSALDELAPVCAPITAKMLARQSVVSASRSGCSVDDLTSLLLRTADKGVTEVVRDRAVLSSLLFQPMGDGATILPGVGKDPLWCRWWRYLLSLPTSEAHVPPVAAHLGMIAACIEQPIPSHSVHRLLRADDVSQIGPALSLPGGVYVTILRFIHFLGQKRCGSDEILQATARDCRSYILRTRDPIDEDTLEWQLFVLLSTALDVELVCALVMRAPLLPSTQRILGLVSRLFHELGLDCSTLPTRCFAATRALEHDSTVSRDDAAAALLRLGSHVAKVAASFQPTERGRDAFLALFMGEEPNERRDQTVLPSVQVDATVSLKGHRFSRRALGDAFTGVSGRNIVKALAGCDAEPCASFSEGVLRRYI